MTGLIQGKDAAIYFQTGSGFQLYGCASEISVTVDTELKSVKTVGDGVWKKQAQQALSYSITLNGLMMFDAYVDGWGMLDSQVNFINKIFRIVFISGTQVKRLEGETIIQSTQLTVTPGDLVKGNFTMPGNGKLNIYNDSGTCASIIIDATLDSPGIGRMFRFMANTDTAYITYELRRNGTEAIISAGNIDYPFTATIPSSIVNGLCHVIATPYCANDVAGTVFTKSF